MDASVLGPRRKQVEFLEDAPYVGLDGLRGNDEGRRDFAVGPALGDLSEDLALARREYVEAIGGLVAAPPDTGSSGRARGHPMSGGRLSRQAPYGR